MLYVVQRIVHLFTVSQVTKYSEINMNMMVIINIIST